MVRRGGMPLPRRVEVLVPVTTFTGASPPATIATIEGLCHVALNAMCPGVYFLCLGPEIVYVGQSVQVIARIASHLSERRKEFEPERVFYLPCPRADLDAMEKHFIAILKPKYNRPAAKDYVPVLAIPGLAIEAG